MVCISAENNVQRLIDSGLMIDSENVYTIVTSELVFHISYMRFAEVSQMISLDSSENP